MEINPEAFDQYRELIGDNWQEFVVDLIDSYLQDVPGMLEALHVSLAQQDEATFIRTAHTLKSNSRIFGAEKLADIAATLEEGGLNGSSENVKVSVPLLETAYARVSQALLNFREQILAGSM
jgi:HPt (histidine-containing phosphotransfer) domain-containing protein